MARFSLNPLGVHSTQPKHPTQNQNMKTKMSSAAAILATLFWATSAQAVPITGEITLSANTTSVSVDFTTKRVSFTPSSPSMNSAVDTVSGNMAILAPSTTAISYKDFFYSPLSVVGFNPIWTTASGSLSFSLTSISSFSETGPNPANPQGVTVYGSGTISSTTAGYNSTAGDWSFTSSKTGTRFTFGSTAAAVSRVPDGGASAILLGVSLLGLAGVSRKFRRL